MILTFSYTDMKKRFNTNRLWVSLLMMNLLLTSCYKEPDLINEISDSVGKVAQVSVVWLGTTRITTANNTVVTGLTVDAGANTFLNVEFISEVAVQEFRIYTITTAFEEKTLLTTIPSGKQVYDNALRCYVLKVPITATSVKNNTHYYFVEVLTINNLLSNQKSAILKTNP